MAKSLWMPWSLLKTASLRESLCQNMIALSLFPNGNIQIPLMMPKSPTFSSQQPESKSRLLSAQLLLMSCLFLLCVFVARWRLESQADGNLLEFC